MSNFKKAFSFRNGVQVDTDNFVVTTAGLVGIGTTIPTEFFHVIGNAKFEDNINIGSVEVTGIGTFDQIKVGSAITISANSGIITATAFYGDGATLSNLPTSQWLDIDPGLGFTSIYAQGNVGVGTDDPTGNYVFQVGSDPSDGNNLPGVGIASDGNARFSGIVTITNGILAGSSTIADVTITDNTTVGGILAVTGPIDANSNLDVSGITTLSALRVTGLSTFTGNIDANGDLDVDGQTDLDVLNVAELATFSGDIDANGNLDVDGHTDLDNVTVGGAITATTFTGNLDGTLLTAAQANITSLGTLSSVTVSGTTDLNGDANVGGRLHVTGVTSTSSLTVNTSVGIGTTLPQSTLQVEAGNNARLDVVTTDPDFPAIVSIGTAVSGNERATVQYSNSGLSINNYDTGGIRINMNEGTNSTTQENFAVVLDNQEILSVSGSRKIGINKEIPESELDVSGDVYVSNNATFVGVVTIGQGANQFVLGDGSPLPIPDSQNFNTNTGISTFNDLDVTNNISIANTTTVSIGDLFVEAGSAGIGTTTTEYEGIDYTLAVFGDSFTYGSSGVTGPIYRTFDGKSFTDPRPDIDETSQTNTVPFLNFGDFQVESGASTIIGGSVSILPFKLKAVPGYGQTNYGLGFEDGGTGYLSVIGINTVFPRSILDAGAASPSINSYFIPPSAPQSTIDIITDLWDPAGGQTASAGHVSAKKTTPNGIVPGAILYNETTNQLEVGIKPKEFAPLGVPIGGIIMWSGSVGSVPSGYKLCDGNDGTPDLRDRFIVGAGNNYAVDSTAGITTSVGTNAYALAYIMRTNA